MLLKQLKLTNFRNYSNLDLNLDERPTILLGDNGAGKSNILEAIYFLSTTKSQRVDQESELVKEGEAISRVEGLIEKEGETSLEINMTQDKEIGFSKRLKVNGVPRRVMDFVGNLPAIIFYPSDINMVTGSPSLRRWHLDLSLAQVDVEYKRMLTLYEQILVNRNRVLKRIKEGEGKVDELDFWSRELLKVGLVVIQKRQDFFEFINKVKTDLGDFSYVYQQSELTAERLDQYSSREIAASSTLIGPHRDDFLFFQKGRNIAHFGSRGEQRTSTLAFKLSTLEFMASKIGVRPVLLLDDVFSELDGKNRTHVTEIAKLQQTVISTVELENISDEFLKSSRVLKVKDGKITE